MDGTDVPLLETERLRLRGHTSADFAQCAAMWSDPKVTQFIGGKPSTGSQTWLRLLAYVGHWKLLGFGYWVIEDRAGDFVGEVGLADFKRAIAPEMQGWPELGFALAARHHGKGFATEAAGAVVAWADRRLAAEKTVALIDPEHRASLRVVEKCGYRLFERGSYNDKPALFLARTKAPS